MLFRLAWMLLRSSSERQQSKCLVEVILFRMRSGRRGTVFERGERQPARNNGPPARSPLF